MATDHILRAITDLQPGDHLGFLYQTEAEHQALLTPFLRQGLEQGEKVLTIVDSYSPETILDYLRGDGVKVEPYLASSQLRIMTSAETHLRTGSFNPDDMIAFWRVEIEQALSEGYRALRGATEMSWALPGLPGSERLLEFESRLNAFLPGSRCLITCLYDWRRLNPEMLFSMLTTHPTTALGTEIQDNFYYLPPADLMADVMPMAVLRKWLKRLAKRKRTEERLREYEKVVEGLEEMIVVVDQEYRYLIANQAFLNYRGLERDQVLGRLVPEVIDKEVFEQVVKEKLDEALQGKVVKFELKYPDPEFGERDLFLSYFPIEGPAGVDRVACILQDITERKRAEENLAYQALLLENVHDAIVAADERLILTAWNGAAEEMYGWTAEEVIGRDIREVVRSEYPEAQRAEAFRILAETGRFSTEAIHHRKDGSAFWIEGKIIAMRNVVGQGTGYIYAFHDITGRKRAEAEIRRHTAQIEALAEISQAMAKVGLDVQAVLETTVRYTAEVIGDFSRLTLLSSDEQWFQPVAFHHSNPEIKTFIESIYPFSPISADPEWFAHILRTGQGVLIPIVDQEQFTQNVQPEYLPFFEQVGVHSILNVPLRVEGRVIGTLGLTRDKPGRPYTTDDQVLLQALADRVALTIENARLFEQVQDAHKQLQALSHRLLKVQEAERRHLARELHDEIGQVLTGLKLLLDINVRLPAKTVQSHLHQAQKLVNEMMEWVDELSINLRPAVLDDLGLLLTLLGHFERYTQQTNIQVTFQQTGLEGKRFSQEMETTIFRLIQEALTNVARHAGVGAVTVRLWVNQDNLGVEIEDQGAGFDPLFWKASTGLSGMRERVALLGGQLTIESALGSGTTITAELPMPDSAQRSDVDDNDYSG
jgi:PAS domain S-box-containing protein